MAAKDYFPRGAFMQALGNNVVAVAYLEKLAHLVATIAQTDANTTDITTLQTSLTADEARIATLESELGDVELLERPGVGLAFVLATASAGSSTPAAPALIATAAENMASGDFGHFFSSGGVNTVQKADGANPAKPANCFVLAAILLGDTGPVQFSGLNTAVTVATPADEVYLSDTTPGGWQTGVPTTSGHIIQPLGPAIEGQGIYFTRRQTIKL